MRLMKRCITITIGNEDHRFELDASDSDLKSPEILIKKISEYSKDNLDRLTSLYSELSGRDSSSGTDQSALHKILQKEDLSSDEINEVLDNYIGNYSIYTLTGYLSSFRIDDDVSKLLNVFTNRTNLGNNTLNVNNFDVFVSTEASNKILTNGFRTILVLNPKSKTSDLKSYLTTLFAINELRNPNGVLYSNLSEIINKHIADKNLPEFNNF